MISLEDFKKGELRTAVVKEAQRIPDTDKLLLLRVDVAGESRQIVSGIAQYYTPEELVGKTVVIVANLETKTIKGHESQGMLLAVNSKEGVALLVPDKTVGSGEAVR